MVKVPKVNRGDASLEIHFSVLVECSVGVNLQLPQSLAWHRSIIQRWLVLVAPRRPAIFQNRDKNNRTSHTCKSLRLYCSHREGSPSQPRKKEIMNTVNTSEIMCSPFCHELSWEVGQHLKEGLHTVLVPAIKCHQAWRILASTNDARICPITLR